MQYGFIKTAAVTPKIQVANPFYNAEQILLKIKACSALGVKIMVFPELCLTGSTCGDLFLQSLLLKEAKEALEKLAKETADTDALIFVGLPWKQTGSVYNTAAALHKGRILALIPRKKLPGDQTRYFTGWQGETVQISPFGYEFPLGSDILLQAKDMEDFSVGCEIGETLWDLHSQAEVLAAAGAVILVNPSAGYEIITKKNRRREFAKVTSLRLLAAYVIAGAGEGESTTDYVFDGHNLIAENGVLLADNKRTESGRDKKADDNAADGSILITDIDTARLNRERGRLRAREERKPEITKVAFEMMAEECKLSRNFPCMPFVPANGQERKERLEEILTLQALGLKKRLKHTRCEHAVVGISGGLDSTLALLVTVKAFDMLGLPRKQIHAITMPCFGTTDRTYENACRMSLCLGAALEEVDIKEAVTLHLKDIKHDIDNHNVTYENAQARERTQVLMDIANRENGMVIGTGDLSELALGWATYNGDHMSMYGVNADVPKTLIRHLVQYSADTCEKEELQSVLTDVLATPVSPELLPPKEGEISQKTEDLVGPYELHDFFLYYMLRFGYEPGKIYHIAVRSFEGIYDKETILKWLKTFCRRFFAQQFKRSCLADGPKVGSVGISPRGDLCMPSDAAAAIWLKQLDEI